MTETLHHALRAMIQFPIIFFGWILPSTNKKINSFLKCIKIDYRVHRTDYFIHEIVYTYLLAIKTFFVFRLLYRRNILVSRNNLPVGVQ
jgi:hypothetical protein